MRQTKPTRPEKLRVRRSPGPIRVVSTNEARVLASCFNGKENGRPVQTASPVLLLDRRTLLRKWNDRIPMSQEEVATIMEVPVSKIQEIEDAALTKIRKAMKRPSHAHI